MFKWRSMLFHKRRWKHKNENALTTLKQSSASDPLILFQVFLKRSISGKNVFNIVQTSMMYISFCSSLEISKYSIVLFIAPIVAQVNDVTHSYILTLITYESWNTLKLLLKGTTYIINIPWERVTIGQFYRLWNGIISTYLILFI